MSKEIDRENALLLGAVTYRLAGDNFGDFCKAFEVYNFKPIHSYHIACDIEDYYE